MSSGPDLPITALAFIEKAAEVSAAVGWQAGVGAMELAGQIVSGLRANPELLPRFMIEGAELFIDGSLAVENGCLTYMSISAGVQSPADLRKRGGREQ